MLPIHLWILTGGGGKYCDLTQSQFFIRVHLFYILSVYIVSLTVHFLCVCISSSKIIYTKHEKIIFYRSSSHYLNHLVPQGTRPIEFFITWWWKWDFQCFSSFHFLFCEAQQSCSAHQNYILWFYSLWWMIKGIGLCVPHIYNSGEQEVMAGQFHVHNHPCDKNVRFCPHFQLFYFNERLEFLWIFEWKIKNIKDADLFSHPPLLIFTKGANISGGHCISIDLYIV